ncbi:MT-A70-domain-containing protein [Endogone sp. FLAS-F59071]|nr:MT-A70-domain-containing protein [Endogone sp. FLAS-F59071]|eukprot:RUS20770.1 MT-A70-domain-containing protein [Endogone sp. FLAS-F59071]
MMKVVTSAEVTLIRVLSSQVRVQTLLLTRMPHVSSSRENTPASTITNPTDHDDDYLFEDEPDVNLRSLLLKESELRRRIDALTNEIENLEASESSASAGGKEGEKEGDGGEEGEAANEDMEEFEAPEWCVPIKANVMNFDWDVSGFCHLFFLASNYKVLTPINWKIYIALSPSPFQTLAAECQFDVILMDPPWQLATHAPTRGVAIAYQQLPDVCIEEMPIQKLQQNGFIFIWVINYKYAKAFELMERWGYSYIDDITWVKQTVNRRMAKGHGYYLQHAKETCLVGKKGDDPSGTRRSVASDVIFSERRGQSQKPEELYEMIEELVPDGKYLEIFGRKNNLRDYWVTIGNEL